MMTEAILNAYAQRLHDMTLCKSREDPVGFGVVHRRAVLAAHGYALFP